MTPNRSIRPDVARNRAALVRAAIETLSEDPAAPLDLVAERAGVGRATLFRHFPSRADLLGAILGGVYDEARELTDRVLVPGRPPPEALGELCRELALLGERYRFLSAHRTEVRALEAELDAPSPDALTAYVERAHAAGELALDVPPALVSHLLRGVLTATLEGAEEAGLDPEDTPALVQTTFLRAIGAA